MGFKQQPSFISLTVDDINTYLFILYLRGTSFVAIWFYGGRTAPELFTPPFHCRQKREYCLLLRTLGNSRLFHHVNIT